MAVTGSKPKPEGQKVTRHAPVHDWTEVPDVPYEGERPVVGRLSAKTLRWWQVVSSMPHCVNWKESDWQFAVDTLAVHAAFVKGKLSAAAELRVREKQMGTTMDARRDLRIRYVVPQATEEDENAGVTSLADYRAALSE